jgi:hypothetical protein
LDADNRNIAAMTAWTIMEEQLGNLDDARHLFERSLQKFAPGTEERKQLWRAYELMEQRCGNEAGAQEVYQRSIRESFSVAQDELDSDDIPDPATEMAKTSAKQEEELPKAEREVEVVRWDHGSSSMKAEGIWWDGDVEGMVPKSSMKKKKSTPTSQNQATTETKS